MTLTTIDVEPRPRLRAAATALLLLATATSCAELGIGGISRGEPSPAPESTSSTPSEDSSEENTEEGSSGIPQPGVAEESGAEGSEPEAPYDPAPEPDHGYEGPSGAPRRTLALGESFDRGAGVLVTVREVRMDLPDPGGSALEPGDAWYAIDVEVCMGETPLSDEHLQSFSDQWTIQTAGGEVLDWAQGPHEDVIDDQLDLYTTEPAAGQCHRGWVVLDGPADAQPVSVRVAIIDDAEWTVTA